VPEAKVRAIIFDIGRVLVSVDFTRALDGLATGLTFTPAEIWTAIEKDPRWPDWQEGRLSARDWHLHLAKRLGGSLTFEQFTQVWNRALVPEPIHDNVIFEKLAKRYRLALLSNTDPIHVAHLELNYAFFQFFKIRIYSCMVGASKPNPVIYREALRACKVQAGEAVYIDDIPAYVEAAQRLGITGIHFHSPSQLLQDFKKLGIQVE
jgi:putative hydrolase of the HAD superfamily